MLNGDDNKNTKKRLIDLTSKKTTCTCNTLFLLISKKQIKFAREARSFVFHLPLFCTTTTLFCTTKTSNFLVTRYFYAAHFHLAGH